MRFCIFDAREDALGGKRYASSGVFAGFAIGPEERIADLTDGVEPEPVAVHFSVIPYGKPAPCSYRGAPRNFLKGTK